jgi:hypothetical protein
MGKNEPFLMLNLAKRVTFTHIEKRGIDAQN